MVAASVTSIRVLPPPDVYKVPDAQPPPNCMPTPNRNAPTTTETPTGDTEPRTHADRRTAREAARIIRVTAGHQSVRIAQLGVPHADFNRGAVPPAEPFLPSRRQVAVNALFKTCAEIRLVFPEEFAAVDDRSVS